MDAIKDAVKQMYSILILTSCMLFVVVVFFITPMLDGKGVFEGTASIYVPMLNENEKQTFAGLKDIVKNEFSPEVIYQNGTQKVGTYVQFKDLFQTEENTNIYLKDIRDKEGNSVLKMLSRDGFESLEEVPAPFVYLKEEGLLYFFGSGLYTVYIKTYGANGGQQAMEFIMPVEAM